ncbi:MAG: Gfo/Idh/MocA family oxidoreductase [Lentisphaerae bacterium]|nr:Gfo/Idh/MocA family oxidoreductase [Lentisphaerota bacterium]
MNSEIFKTDKRIKLGIWGLGRGMAFYKICEALNFDVKAGCDFNKHMREKFLKNNPSAFVTDNADDFLNSDIDAVLLATFCPAHGPDAVKCLQAGKHVLSEVTAFHTPAEGVKLVETVEKTGLIYNLSENYPFTKVNMYLKKHWKNGLFGDLMYAEYEYVHEVRSLSYTYIDNIPIQPGYSIHNWRSWLNYHYYNTHSLGPVMYITGERPTRVVALLSPIRLPGYPVKAPMGLGGVTPSLISFANGGLMRNLMGGTSNDAHSQRIWGTKGAADWNEKVYLRLGGAGYSPKLEITPDWPELGEYASTVGHGGGDFWTLYYFARQILFGTPAPFEIYKACDCTLPGILAYRSALENGKPYDVPNFRDKKQRAKYRSDNFAQQKVDTETHCFPTKTAREKSKDFTSVMKDLIRYSLDYAACKSWLAVTGEVAEPHKVVVMLDKLIESYPDMIKTVKKARKIADASPKSEGARAINELLAVADATKSVRKSNLNELMSARNELLKKIRRY